MKLSTFWFFENDNFHEITIFWVGVKYNYFEGNINDFRNWQQRAYVRASQKALHESNLDFFFAKKCHLLVFHPYIMFIWIFEKFFKFKKLAKLEVTQIDFGWCARTQCARAKNFAGNLVPYIGTILVLNIL